jgi:carbonic anhydrase
MQAWEQGANDHAFEVSFSAEGCSNLKVVYENTSYTFLQYHFHSPSEHTVAGAYFSAEAHMVHKSAAGKLLVIGVFLQEAQSSFPLPNNSFLNIVWGGRSIRDISMNKSYVHDVAVNPYTSFTPGSLKQFVYEGSLTTPPCSEHVQWLVYTEPVFISSDDIRILRGAAAAFKWGNALSGAGDNNRPVQPLNGRVVKMSTGMPEASTDDNSSHEDEKGYSGIPGLILGIIALALIGVVLVLLAYIFFKFYPNFKFSSGAAEYGAVEKGPVKAGPGDAEMSEVDGRTRV